MARSTTQGVQSAVSVPESSAQADGAGTRQASFSRTGTQVLAGLLIYMLVATLVIAWERTLLFEAVAEMETVHQQDEQQIALNFAVSHTVLGVNEHYFAKDIPAAARIINLDLDSVISMIGRIGWGTDETHRHLAELNRLNLALQAEPSRAVIGELREELHNLVLHLDQTTSANHARKQDVMHRYRAVFHRLTAELFALMAIGVALFGGISSLFFRNLSRDIGAVRLRAGEIVRGYRGAPLAVTRGDELGDLMSAVNDMEAELRSRDSELELSRQQHFHTEKMAAVGSLAAAVAHEINNPLAAIVGLAEDLVMERKKGGYSARSADRQIDLILEQARRVMTITRQIGEFSLQRPLVPTFIDLNALIKSTCTFISFDKRFRGVTLQHDLAPDLPALHVVSDHIVQVLMNVLINAADALEGREDQAPTIRVDTRLDGGFVLLTVSDNGPGIAPENLARVFDAHFTTKPPGRGSGLGLSLCRSLVQQDGGDIKIISTAGQGASVRIALPVPNDAMH